MKKLFSRFFLTLCTFCLLSLTLTACGDDEDNGGGGSSGSGSCTLTVDGERLFRSGNFYMDAYYDRNDDKVAIMATDYEFERSFTIIIPHYQNLRKGLDLCNDDRWKESDYGVTEYPSFVSTFWRPGGDDLVTSFITAGSLVVKDFRQDEYIELEFKNCKMYELPVYYPYDFESGESAIVSGTLKASLRDVDEDEWEAGRREGVFPNRL